MADDPTPLTEEELDAVLRRSGQALQANLSSLVDSEAGLAQVHQEAGRRLQPGSRQIADDADSGATGSMLTPPSRLVRDEASGRGRTLGSGTEPARYATSPYVAAVAFDEIEFAAARTGDHVRAAVRMSELARQAEPGLRAETHLRVGEQWMMADEPQQAADEFAAAIEDGGPTFADPRVYLARALFALGSDVEAERLLAQLAAKRTTVSPRTCDLIAELMTEQGDLRAALDWATVGVELCLQHGDDTELQLLLRLRYRIRVDLGLEEDDYDRALKGPSAR